MELLDLSIHDRDDYEGKAIECRGRRYVIGQRLGVGAERIVHILTNELSGLSILVIKILKIPRPRGVYTTLISQLRSDIELARVTTVTLEVDVPGGMVEIQPNVESRGADPAGTHVRQGFDALTGKTPSPLEARKHFGDALRLNPSHCEALYGMAHALWRANETSQAFMRISEAVDIEPMYLPYWRTYVELARATGQYAYALQLYREAVRLFEHVYDLEELAAEILLDAGNPDEATQCVTRAIVTPERRAELEKEVSHAIEERTRARALMQAARASVMAKDWKTASSALMHAQAVYNRDPELCMNTAFATLHDGDPRVCASLMLHASMVVSDPLAATCAANAGFAMLKANEIAHAMGVLDMAALRLSALCGGEIPANEVDLPSVGIWIDGDELIEERVGVAEEIIATGLARAAALHVQVPPRVQALAAAYFTAAESRR
jgi:Flp pilus assembly protein TadD